MLNQRSVRTKLVSSLILVLSLPTASARQSDTPQSVPVEKRLAMGEKEAKRMLRLMDKDQNGKISKREFMSFMEAEFERLDVNKDGELDVKELMQSQVQVRGHSR